MVIRSTVQTQNAVDWVFNCLTRANCNRFVNFCLLTLPFNIFFAVPICHLIAVSIHLFFTVPIHPHFAVPIDLLFAVPLHLLFVVPPVCSANCPPLWCANSPLCGANSPPLCSANAPPLCGANCPPLRGASAPPRSLSRSKMPQSGNTFLRLRKVVSFIQPLFLKRQIELIRGRGKEQVVDFIGKRS